MRNIHEIYQQNEHTFPLLLHIRYLLYLMAIISRISHERSIQLDITKQQLNNQSIAIPSEQYVQIKIS